MSKFSTAWNRLAYMDTGEFSITRLMAVITFFLALSVGIFGIVVYVVNGTSLPNEIYTYFGSLAGGGFVQYAVTKVTNTMGAKE